MARDARLQGYLAHKKQLPTLGPPYDPRHSPTVGSYGGGGLMSEVSLYDAYGRGSNGDATRWSTTLSSKITLPYAINFRALCDAKLVTYPSKFGGNETLELHLADL